MPRIQVFDDWITMFGLFRSTAKTEVTFGVPLPRIKQDPGISRFCPTEQSPVEGDAERTTGARSPSSIGQVID